MEKIMVRGEDGEEIVLYPVEETRLNGVNYLLAADKEEGDSDVYILKDCSGPADTEAEYVFVEDDKELNAVASVFGELLEGSGAELA